MKVSIDGRWTGRNKSLTQCLARATTSSRAGRAGRDSLGGQVNLLPLPLPPSACTPQALCRCLSLVLPNSGFHSLHLLQRRPVCGADPVQATCTLAILAPIADLVRV